MKDRTALRTGVAGAIIAAVCCFTPVLVIALGFAGLSAVVSWLDYGLFPLLFASMGLVAHGLFLRAGRPGPSPAPFIIVAVIALSALLFWLEFRYALRLSLATAFSVAAYAYVLRARRQRSPGASPETEDSES